MKKNRILSLLMAVILIVSLAGCSDRKKQESQNQAQNENQEPSTDKTEPVIPPDQEPIPPITTPDIQPPTEPIPRISTEEIPNPDEEKKEDPSIASSKPITITDANYSAISCLDAQKKGWGPGGPVDENNRSTGAISYQELYGKYDADFVGKVENKIFLTFDEGYENGYTSVILDVLKEKNVSATFFVTMPYVKENPDLIRRMIDEGHIVGNHSVSHPSFPDTPLSECQTEIVELHNYVLENFQYTMTLFRFPMGEFNEQDLKLVQDCGYRSVFWSFAYKDWLVDQQPNPQDALKTIIDKAHPGGIYLLHAVSKTNTEILGQAIDELKLKGYDIVPYEPAC